MAEKLIVIGNGLASMRTVEELLKLVPDWKIHLDSGRPYPIFFD